MTSQTPPTAARLHRGLAALLLVLSLSLISWLGVACQWDGWLPMRRGAPPAVPPPVDPIPMLELGNAERSTLDCPAGECLARYRLELPEPGEISLSISPTFSSDEVGMRVMLKDAVGRVLGQQRAEGEKAFELRLSVRPGVYTVLLQSIGGTVHYGLTARFSSGPMPSTPAAEGFRERAPLEAPPGNTVATAGGSLGSDAAWNPSVDFSAYRQFAFSERPQERLEAEPGTPIGDPFLDQQIQRAIRYELLDRGILESPQREADFVVSTHAQGGSRTWYSVNHVVYSAGYGMWFDRWTGMGLAFNPTAYRNGTLVIDVIDSRTGDLIWHGWTTQAIPGVAVTDDFLRAVVKEVLGRFPPAPR